MSNGCSGGFFYSETALCCTRYCRPENYERRLDKNEWQKPYLMIAAASPASATTVATWLSVQLRIPLSSLGTATNMHQKCCMGHQKPRIHAPNGQHCTLLARKEGKDCIEYCLHNYEACARINAGMKGVTAAAAYLEKTPRA